MAHNGNLIPVPGRDLLSQAWYQGGHSVMDFTDSSNPKEIAYYDRGPPRPDRSTSPGSGRPTTTTATPTRPSWPAGSTCSDYTPTANMSANEIEAASEPRDDRLNAQLQTEIEWDPSFAVVRSHLDQLVRAGCARRLAAREGDAVHRQGGGDLEPQEGSGTTSTRPRTRSAAIATTSALRDALKDLRRSL